MGLILRWLLSALALIAITYIVPGIVITNFYAALVAALVLGLVNALIRPIIVVLTLPFNILTLGLFTLVINALFCSHRVSSRLQRRQFWPNYGWILMWVFNWFIAICSKINVKNHSSVEPQGKTGYNTPHRWIANRPVRARRIRN